MSILKIFRNTLYIRLSVEKLSILQVETNYLVSDIPVLAIEKSDNTTRILGYGQHALTFANQLNVEIVNGFKHPRTILADFAVIELTMRLFVKEALKQRRFVINPLIIFHVLDEFEGGLTQVELRGLREVCVMVGARQVYCWEGLELSLDDLQTLSFPTHKGKLLNT